MRMLTCAFLQSSGQNLRLPQLTIATAIVFFHRFYARMSYEHYDRFTVATTCLFLASKVEETPKKLKDVVIETFKVHHNAEKAPEVDSKEFFELKEKILVCERILLQALGFDLSVEHAYRPLLAYVKSIKGTRDLAQVAWNFINDSLRTTISLQYAPRHLAAAAAQLARRYLSTHTKKDLQFPDHAPGSKWFVSFQTTEETIADITNQILAMYREKGGNPTGGLSEAALQTLMTEKTSPDDHVAVAAATPADGLAAFPSAAPPAASASHAPQSHPTDSASVKIEPKVKVESNSAAMAASPMVKQDLATSVKHEAGVGYAPREKGTAHPNSCKRPSSGGEGRVGLEGEPDGVPDAKRSRPEDA